MPAIADAIAVNPSLKLPESPENRGLPTAKLDFTAAGGWTKAEAQGGSLSCHSEHFLALTSANAG
jgi:hypothetical protein